MRMVVLAVALSLGLPVCAQDQDKAPKKKQARQAVHKKASPEQIRKFNDLEKKQPK